MRRTCDKLGKDALAAHAASIKAASKFRDLTDELNYERAHDNRRPGVPESEFTSLRRAIKIAKAAKGVSQVRYERLMQAYRRQCRR